MVISYLVPPCWGEPIPEGIVWTGSSSRTRCWAGERILGSACAGKLTEETPESLRKYALEEIKRKMYRINLKKSGLVRNLMEKVLLNGPKITRTLLPFE